MSAQSKYREEIEERCKPLSELHQRVFYVYEAYVDGELRYIGKGKGARWKHCGSGKSSCSELNKDFHEGKKIEVVIRKDKLLEYEAEGLEIELIRANVDSGIYNKRLNTDLSSKPNLERMKDVKIIAQDKEDKLIKHLCNLSSLITKHDFEKLRSQLDMCGLVLYLTEIKGSAPVLVLDKPKFSDSDVRHLGCKNWPNCGAAGGCGEW